MTARYRFLGVRGDLEELEAYQVPQVWFKKVFVLKKIKIEIRI